jgi:hypothetical protein
MFLSPNARQMADAGVIIAAVRGDELVRYRFPVRAEAPWPNAPNPLDPIPLPPNTGTAKAVIRADVGPNRTAEGAAQQYVFTCEHAKGKSGVVWLECRTTDRGPACEAHEISGPVGTKYDLVEAIDLDADGDLDILTCEEAENLGVIWYENPARHAARTELTRERSKKE